MSNVIVTETCQFSVFYTTRKPNKSFEEVIERLTIGSGGRFIPFSRSGEGRRGCSCVFTGNGQPQRCRDLIRDFSGRLVNIPHGITTTDLFRREVGEVVGLCEDTWVDGTDAALNSILDSEAPDTCAATSTAKFLVNATHTEEFRQDCQTLGITIANDGHDDACNDEYPIVVEGPEKTVEQLGQSYKTPEEAEHADGYEDACMDRGLFHAEPRPYRSRHTGGMGFDEESDDDGYEAGWNENDPDAEVEEGE